MRDARDPLLLLLVFCSGATITAPAAHVLFGARLIPTPREGGIHSGV